MARQSLKLSGTHFVRKNILNDLLILVRLCMKADPDFKTKLDLYLGGTFRTLCSKPVYT